MIVTSPKRAARKRNCIGTTRATHAVNSTADGDKLRRHPEVWYPSEVSSCRALTHGAKARRAHPKHASGVECPTPSATVEAVCTAAALRLQRTQQQRAFGAREARCSCSSSREQRPAGSPWCLRPTRSFRPRLTACGRRVRSVGNDWWRRGGQPTLILDAPALPKSRCGQRCIGSRLAADLHWKVDPDALLPMARCT